MISVRFSCLVFLIATDSFSDACLDEPLVGEMSSLSVQDPSTPPPLPPKKRSLAGGLSPMATHSPFGPFTAGWSSPPTLPDLVSSHSWMNESFDSMVQSHSMATAFDRQVQVSATRSQCARYATYAQTLSVRPDRVSTTIGSRRTSSAETCRLLPTIPRASSTLHPPRPRPPFSRHLTCSSSRRLSNSLPLRRPKLRLTAKSIRVHWPYHRPCPSSGDSGRPTGCRRSTTTLTSSTAALHLQLHLPIL